MRLSEQLWAVAKEYTRQTAELLEVPTKYVHWIGTDDCGGILDLCDLGGRIYLTLSDMQLLIDNLPEWVDKYGTKENAAKEVIAWWDYCLDNIKGEKRKINLKSWMKGLR